MPSPFSVVFVTAPNGRAAARIADALLKKRLAACVNIVPGLVSRYWWKGKRESSRESLLIIKTRATLLARVEACVKAAHPYDVPEIISLPISRGSSPYLAWLARETR